MSQILAEFSLGWMPLGVDILGRGLAGRGLGAHRRHGAQRASPNLQEHRRGYRDDRRGIIVATLSARMTAYILSTTFSSGF